MVENQRKKNAPKVFDIHRNLPAHGARPPIVEAPKAKAEKTHWSIKKRLVMLVVLLLLASLAFLIFIGAWDERNISTASQKLFGSSSLLSLVRGGSLKTDSGGRVNVLLVGYSADDPNHPGAQLTDSLLLLSMNPSDYTGYLLSIPRDLYVNLGSNNCQDANQYCKINEAYEDGGMGLLEQTIKTDFNLSTNYYAIIDYAAVKGLVNALGGVAVNIQSTDPRGLYDPNINVADGGPLLLKNGPQTLNGQTALNLTRARGDPCSCGSVAYGFNNNDFDRTQNQRQLFTAIKSRLNWKLVLNPRKNSQILNAVADNIKTDIPINAVRPLFGLFNSIPSSKLRSLSLNNLNGMDLLQSYDSYASGAALIPTTGFNDYSQIDAALQQIK